MLKKLLAHKFRSALAIAVLLGAGYFVYRTFFASSTPGPSYQTTGVVKGTLVSAVSGSGQVSASNQIDLKPKVSGDLVTIAVSNGQAVKTGQVIAQIDASDARKAVRDAEVNLESAKLALQKLQAPADELSLLTARNSLAAAEQSKTNSEADLLKAYEDGFNAVSSAFLQLPDIMSGLHDILYSQTFLPDQVNIDYLADQVKGDSPTIAELRDHVNMTYKQAREKYDKIFLSYKSVDRNSSQETIESLINETYETSRLVAEAVKSGNIFFDFYTDLITAKNHHAPSQVATYQSSLETYTGYTNNHLSNLLGVQATIKNTGEAIVTADRTIAEKTASLKSLVSGADGWDIKSQQLAVTQRENALLDARQKLADYSIRAPFEGVIAKVNVKRGEQVSSGTAIATLITTERLAEISLNEVDAARVKVGQKTTLTFDALENLSVTGAVAEIGQIGSVTQNVVSYAVKIRMDMQDERIKSGMSVSAAIVTDVKADVLMVPNSAVKSAASGSYVEELTNGVLQPKSVIVGLSNDTMTEISGDLTVDEQVITQTITSATSAATQTRSAGSIIPFGGGGGVFRPR